MENSLKKVALVSRDRNSKCTGVTENKKNLHKASQPSQTSQIESCGEAFTRSYTNFIKTYEMNHQQNSFTQFKSVMHFAM